MTHTNQNDYTTEQFSVRSAGARLWLLELAGYFKSVYLAHGLLDYRDIPTAEAEPDAPPPNRVREFWRNSVKQYKNSDGKVVRQLGFDQVGVIEIDIVGKGVGASKTTTRADGCTLSEQFGINDEIFTHVDIPGRLDPDEDAEIHVEWFPVGSEAGKLITWEVDVVRIEDGALVNKAADVTLTATDEASPATAFTSIESSLVLAKAHLVTDEALHICVRRIASSNDPTVAAAPAVAHVELIYRVK